MQPLLTGLQIAVIGGDAREVFLAEKLSTLGASVWLHGFARYPEPLLQPLRHGLPQSADVLVLPLLGISPDNTIYATYATEKIRVPELEPLLGPGVLMLCGRMNPLQEQQLSEFGVRVLLTSQLEELVIHNSIPTAEGALEAAMRLSKITIHGSSVLVTGFGRCAQPLARLLASLGAHVTIVARRREVLASAVVLGYQSIPFYELANNAVRFDFLFNTVPSLVLTRNILLEVRKDALILDIASTPGGTDFKEAKKLGLHAQLLPGLPGKVAPITAGKMMASIFTYYINLHRKEEPRHEV